MRRIAAVALLDFLDALDPPEARVGPRAFVLARAGQGRDGGKVTGGTRVDDANALARARGVRPGQTLAQARARTAELSVRVVREDEVRAGLEHVAEACARFGAPVSFEGRTAWVDVTTSAALFGGEEGTARALHEAVGALGHARRVAIASGPRVGAAVAHFGPARAEVIVVPRGGDRDAMRALPLASIAAELGDAYGWLARLGFRRVGDLSRAPRRGLGSRLGARAASALALADGEDRAPLVPWSRPEVPVERADFEYGVEHTEALLFVSKGLAERLARRLEGRGVSAGRLVLRLTLDRALVPAGASRELAIECALPAPMRRAEDLLAVLTARLDRVALPAPALVASLEAHEVSAEEGRALHLFVAESKAERYLERVTAELGALVGEERVGTLAVVDALDPRARTRLVPIAERRPKDAPLERLVSAAPEPVRWLRAPEPCAEGPSKLLVRVACVEWWRRAPAREDYVAQRAPSGDVACVRVSEDGARAIVGWMD